MKSALLVETLPVTGPVLNTPEELAALLKVPVKTIYYWVYRKQIPYLKVGRHLRFKSEEVIKYFMITELQESNSCFGRPDIIRVRANRSLKVRSTNSASEKE